MPERHLWATSAAGNDASWPAGTMLYGDVDDRGREQMAEVGRWDRDNRGDLTSGGTANALTLTPSATHTAYFDGMRFRFRAGNSNSGAATLNVSALGARTITKIDPLAPGLVGLAADDIVGDGVYDVVYDNGVGAFVLLNPTNRSETRKHLTSTTNYSLASTDHAYQVGADANPNVVGDDTGFQARDNGVAVALELQRAGGNVSLGPATAQGMIWLPDGMQSDNNGTPATMNLNAAGGAVACGAALSAVGAITGASAAITGAITGASATLTGAITGASSTLTGGLSVGDEILGAGSLGVAFRYGNSQSYLDSGDHGTLDTTDAINAVLMVGSVTTDCALPASGGVLDTGSWVVFIVAGNTTDLTVGGPVVGSAVVTDDSAGGFVFGSDGNWYRMF